jgi:hypothetical protein
VGILLWTWIEKLIFYLLSSIFYYTKGKGWNPNAFSKTLMDDLMDDVMYPLVIWHLCFHLLADTFAMGCFVDWFGILVCVYVATKLVVACCFVWIEWHLPLPFNFSEPLHRLSPTLFLTHSSSPIWFPHSLTFSLSLSLSLSVPLVLTPSLCFALSFPICASVLHRHSLRRRPFRSRPSSHHRLLFLSLVFDLLLLASLTASSSITYNW